MYLELLQEAIDPALTVIVENNNDYLEDELMFQQDRAPPPHYAHHVREFLNHTFPNRWIGRRGAIEWPPRSPDLSPLDYFLWRQLKTKIYATQTDSLEDLRQRIINECRLVTPEMLQNVRQRFEQNLYNCMDEGGQHFEHLL
uniref:Transposable element Tc3 transposase n=1 Tax=Anoplophora glabripennis TaxID=217634 RepID=V5G5F0_ANOGL